MQCFKSAQIPDFSDVNVRRVFGYAYDLINKHIFSADEYVNLRNNLIELERELKVKDPHISLAELKTKPVWNVLQNILQPSGTSTHWTANP